MHWQLVQEGAEIIPVASCTETLDKGYGLALWNIVAWAQLNFSPLGQKKVLVDINSWRVSLQGSGR